jgi:hypothetical protein
MQKLRETGNPTYQHLAQYVASKYKNSNWPNLPSIQRPIWESLIIIRDREFHHASIPPRSAFVESHTRI